MTGLRISSVFFVAGILLLFCARISTAFFPGQDQSGILSIYFMEKKVGYEEYSWQEDERGYLLSVHGRMTEPVRIEIESLSIRMDKAFIPQRFQFKGSVSGREQEISCVITDGRAEILLKVQGKEQKSTVNIKRDAFLLPNPIFSPYMAVTKKYRCSLEAPLELSAYIIPQMESPFALEAKEGFPCTLNMQMGMTQIELETDETGELKSLHLPSQNLRITKD